MPDMTPTSFAAARTGKIIKNGIRVFERGENFLQNGVLHFAFKFKPIVRNLLQSYRICTDEKLALGVVKS